MSKQIIAISLAIAIAIYIAFCLAVYYCPQLFFYHPAIEKMPLPTDENYPATEVYYKAEDGTPLYAWYHKPKGDKPIIVFLHGNAFNVGHFYHKLLPLIEAGYGAFVPECRGFSGIEGKITQAGLEMDTRAALKKLRRLGYTSRRIVLYGMSLGSYTATYAAAQLQDKKPFAGLILEVPFDSLMNTASKHVWVPLPVSLIVKDKFENQQNITQINTPLLVMAAEEDTVVPVELARELFALAKQPKELIIYDNVAHSNLYDTKNYEDILVWLKNNEKTQ